MLPRLEWRIDTHCFRLGRPVRLVFEGVWQAGLAMGRRTVCSEAVKLVL